MTNKLIKIRTKILSLCVKYLNNERFNNQEFEVNPLWIIINKIVLGYYKDNDGKPSPQWDYDNLIKPIKEQLLVEPYRFDEMCNKLLGLAKTGGDFIFSIKEFNEELCKEILRATELTDSSLNQLRELYKKLNNAP